MRESADFREAILGWTVSMYFDGKSKKTNIHNNTENLWKI